ncbi:hypothetical protein [Pseudomonas amygdali]|uniref:Uncharacterized protein n=1 Tax=Pseudomonas amygdali pv. lachrymans str. M301315 TaxID=629260 RepID=A0AAD0PX42_PSEAV|nr:hypothetical protein [Pseudomonas amygdali]AXH60356.1 hypothetical protein PLA107_034870 [Pseudomonas amygdali pv. lachrymans str. M301315]
MPFFIILGTLLILPFTYQVTDDIFGDQFPRLPLYVFGVFFWIWLSSIFIWLMRGDPRGKGRKMSRLSGDGADFDFDGGSDSGGDGGGGGD